MILASSVPIPCNRNQDCPSGMVCASKQCSASQTSIANVLVDVSLPSSTNAEQYSGMGFVLPLDVPTQGHSDITLPDLVPLSLDASFPNSPDGGTGCNFSSGSSNGTLVQVEVTHRWPVDGLERCVFTAASLPTTFSAVPANSGFNYEVYFALSNKSANGDPNCDFPPVLLRDVGVQAGRALTLTWPSPKSIALDVQVQVSAIASGSDLQGWKLDVVDPIQGRVLAIPVTLGAYVIDTNDSSLAHYQAAVSYNPIMSADSSPPVGTEIVRLQPPQGVSQPTYYVSMSGLSLFAGSNEAPLPINAVPTEVSINGLVETADQSRPVQAPIAFLSTGFSVGNSGIWAEYSATTQSDSSGNFQVTLPAGQYRVIVVPPGDGKHAVLDTQWTITATSNPTEWLLSVPVYSQIQGSIDKSLQLSPSQSATVVATPSNSLLYDKPTEIVALRSSSPGARTASVIFQPQSNPQFVLPVDVGRFDISLQPPEGLPWLVSPGLEVVSGTNTLQSWTMPLPVPWSGILRTPPKNPAASPSSSNLPSAVLRVYALLDDSQSVVSAPNLATSIVQIAETRTQNDGSFQLELPDQFQP